MKRFLAVLAVLCGFIPGSAFAAGTIVETLIDHVSGQSVTVTTYTMTSDAAVSAGTFPATAVGPIDGWIIGVETNPGAVTPTADYDITLVDVDGADVMAGALADRSATLTQKVISPQPYVRGNVTITPTNNSENSAVVVMKITVLR